MRSGLMRQAVAPQEQFKTDDKTLGAPLNGWITSTNVNKPKEESAVILRNMFPQRRSVRLRGGAFRKATISASLAVQSIFTYESGAVAKLFAATSGAIYDITSPADPLVPPTADITGQTTGYYSTAPFANAAGAVFLTVVNGTEARQIYDGSAWATTPAITAITGDTNGNTLSHVWVFANRLFFVQKNTFDAWYMPVDTFGGAVAGKVSLAGIFQGGGSLLSGSTWSTDSGDGMHDLCVFISTLGEVAVFQGTDPSSASTWAKVGVYTIGKMLGKNALLKVAGDLLLMTADGFVPMSMVQKLDRGALSLNAISWQIEPDWKVEAQARPDNWTCVKWPEKNMTIVALPSGTNLDLRNFVANTETGAWGEYTGWDTNCIAMFQGNAYFGTGAGTILLAENSGSDDGANYVSVYVGQYEDFGYKGREKVAQLMRSTFIASVPFTPKVGIAVNYRTTLANPPSAAPDVGGSVWDVGLWDVALWDTAGVQTIQTRWRSVFGAGFVMAPIIQVTSGGANTPDAQLISNQVEFGLGAIVV